MPSTLTLRWFLCAALLAGVAACERAPAAQPPYNVLFISLDSVRRDLVGCYGRRPRHAPKLSTSPALDRLAAEGVRMADAWAASPWTLPSHASMFTGQPAMVHAVETDLHTLDRTERTLTEVLASAGYRTAGFFSGPYLDPHWGFARGFERYQGVYGDDVTRLNREVESVRVEVDRLAAAGDEAAAHELRWRARALFESVRRAAHDDVSSAIVTEMALEEMEAAAREKRPWFLFAHYFDPHYDFIPPAPWDTTFDPQYAGEITGLEFMTNPALSVPDPAAPGRLLQTASARDLEHVRALYEGELAWTDHNVDRLLRRLDELDLTRRTLVVVLSDHGEEFLEHAGLGHRRTVYEEVLRIPMLLRLPGVLPAGAVVPGYVTTADVFPTILELLHVKAPPYLGSESFVSLIEGRADPAATIGISRLVHFEVGTLDIDGTTTVPARQVTVDEAFAVGRVKIVRARTWPLFPLDLPQPTKTLLEEHADERYRQETLVWIDVERFPAERAADISRQFDDPAARAALTAVQERYRNLLRLHTPATRRQLDASLRVRLEALGYLEDEEASQLPGSHSFRLPPPDDASGTRPH